MSSEDASTAGGERPVTSQARGPKSATPSLGARIPNWILVMGLGLLAGAAAWLVGERTFEYSRPSKAAESIRSFEALNAEMPGVNAINGALTFGVLGGLLGLALGLAGGLSSRSSSRALTGAVAGLILGSAAGALPSFAVMPWQWRHRNDDPNASDLLVPLFIHLALWSALGLAAGLAFGIGCGGTRRSRLVEAALAGLVGAILGTFVFEMVGAMLFPFAHTADPFSATSGTRLLARLCVCVFVAIGAIRSLPREVLEKPATQVLK
jgi:hypothetical protein